MMQIESMKRISRKTIHEKMVDDKAREGSVQFILFLNYYKIYSIVGKICRISFNKTLFIFRNGKLIPWYYNDVL